MTDADRWERLRALLEETLGTPVRLNARAYSQSRYGRVEHGVSYSITLRHADGGTVDVDDRWWAKNDAKWLGYTVTAVGRDSIDRGRRAGLRSRHLVVTAVVDLLGAVPVGG